MKYGLIVHKNTKNLGNDIQSYAIARKLPSIDYIIEREEVDQFKSENDELVATFFSGWYMWNKWNWPPSRNIIPKFLGFHYTDYYKATLGGCPIDYEFLSGIGKKYITNYGVVGARDVFTKEHLENININSNFSGSMLLSLDREDIPPCESEYICICDVNEYFEKVLRKKISDDVRIEKVSQEISGNDVNTDWAIKEQRAKTLIAKYQNAKCVVTSRLSTAVTCLALDVSVLFCIKKHESIRVIPYYEWLYCCDEEELLSGNLDYDFMNPPKNKDLYKKYQKSINEEIDSFIKMTQTTNEEDLFKIDYTQEEEDSWKLKKMINTIEKWITIINGDRTQIRGIKRGKSTRFEIFLNKIIKKEKTLDSFAKNNENIPNLENIYMLMYNEDVEKITIEECRYILEYLMKLSRTDFIELRQLLL